MALLFSESFTGTSGAAWDSASWTTGRNPTSGGGATIQTNQGQLASGNIGSYSGNDRISRRLVMATPADVDLQFKITFNNTEVYPRAYVRANSIVDSGTGYYLAIDKGSWNVGKSISYGTTQLSPTTSYTYSQGTQYAARLYVAGSSIKAKLWNASVGEPAEWGYEGTDTSITAAGSLGFTVGGGNAAVSSSVLLDDIVVSDAVMNTAPNVNVGTAASVEVGTVFSRTATASDSDGTIVSYAWTIQSSPGSSTTSLQQASTATVSFTPDVIGSYILRCTVFDNGGSGSYAELTLTAVAASGVKHVRIAGGWQRARIKARIANSWQ